MEALVPPVEMPGQQQSNQGTSAAAQPRLLVFAALQRQRSREPPLLTILHGLLPATPGLL